MPKVLTIGSFDLVHYGHIAFLQECEKLGEVTVGVNSDKFIQTFKPAPTMSEDERMYAINLLGYMTKLNVSAGKELIEREKPHILAIGSDWARKDYLEQIGVTQDWLDEKKIILAYVPYVQKYPISSTEIKRRIRES